MPKLQASLCAEFKANYRLLWLRFVGFSFFESRFGCSVVKFERLVVLSGLVLNVLCALQVRWITFHSSYDFGYLLKVLTCQPLPATESEFFQLLKVYSIVYTLFQFAFVSFLGVQVYFSWSLMLFTTKVEHCKNLV